MSLALAAKHLAAKGRGKDSMLVHMSPKEVSALQHVAMAHGGSLSVNPDTGLPEASFLEAVLPTVLGVGLAATGIGAPIAAGMVGAAQYARTGDLNKGLMAGLGAYGGAGIGEGLASAGGEAAKQAATTTPTAVEKAAGWQGVPYKAPAPLAPSATGVTQSAMPQSVANPSQFLQNYTPSVPPTRLDYMGAGLKNVSGSADAFGSFAGANKYPAMAAGLSTAAGAGAFDAPKPPEPEKGTIRPYKFSPGYTGGAGGGYADYGDQNTAYTGERLWFQPSYTTLPTMQAASGGLVAMARGGNPRGTMPKPKPKPNVPSTPPPATVIPAPTPAPTTGGYRPRPEYEKYPAYTPPTGVPPYGGQPTPPPSYAPAGFAPEMSGQSRDAFAYLMGKLPATPVAPMPTIRANPTTSTSDYGRFTYNPMTQQFTEHEVAPPAANTPDTSGHWAGRWSNRAKGGGLESGGFVVPADVVSALGNGSSSAGLELLAKRIGARPIKGPGDGMSDSIPTSIEGKQKAAVARDEAYVPREQVAKAGGSKKLYAMMDKIRHQAHGKTKQQRKLANPAKLVP